MNCRACLEWRGPVDCVLRDGRPLRYLPGSPCVLVTCCRLARKESAGGMGCADGCTMVVESSAHDKFEVPA